MPTQVQFRRGTAAQNDAFRGANGEITIDLTNKSLRVHDGNTSGGFKLATSSELLSVSAIALAAYDQANAANLLAFNTGIGANAYATAVGLASNAYAQSIGIAANTIAIAAFDKANAANLLAFNTGIGANAYANSVGVEAKNWANTKVSSVTGTAGQIYSSGGTTPTLNLITTGVSSGIYGGASQIPVITVDAFGRLTSASNVSVQGMDYAYANSIGFSSNAYAQTVGIAANTIAIAAFNQANAANVLAFNTGTYANNTFLKLTSPNQTITGNLLVSGSVTVTGNSFIVDTQSLRVSDPLIYLAGNNFVSDIIDIGFVANYVNATGSNVHTGLFRDATVKEYYLFQGYDKVPDPNHIDPNSNNFTLAVLNADIKTSNLTLGGANAILWIKSAYDQANSKVSSVTGTAGQIFSSGGTTPTLNLITTGVSSGIYGGTTQIPVITIDSFGRLTSASNVAVQGMDYAYANAIGASSNAWANAVGSSVRDFANTKFLANTTGVFSGSLTFTGNVAVADGSNVSPSYTFANSGNTGIYRTSNNAIAFTISGSDTIVISDSDATDNVLFEILNENQESVFTVSANTDENAFELYDANNASLLLVSVNSSELLVNTALDIQNTAVISTRTLTTTSNVQTELTRFSTTAFTGGRFSLMAKSGANTQMSELSVLHDGTTAAYTEYGIIYSNNSISLYDVIADVNVGNVRILVTPALNESTTFKVLESKLV